MSRERKEKMDIGILINLTDKNIREKLKNAHELGFSSCQICGWNKELFTEEIAEDIKAGCSEYKITVSSFWCGWSGPAKWNFYEGPTTLGLVPEEFRFIRAEELKQGSDFAKMIGVKNLVTHVGFLPEDPNSEKYAGIVSIIKYVAEYCKENCQNFLFETGQETPVTLLRVIEDVGTGNLGINLDPANLILYGKANPVDALEVFGEFVRDIHGKDGCYPTDGKNLGKEMPLGQGKVNFPAFVKKLKEIGYNGPITIEREISGDEQIKDIKAAKEYLEELINN